MWKWIHSVWRVGNWNRNRFWYKHASVLACRRQRWTYIVHWIIITSQEQLMHVCAGVNKNHTSYNYRNHTECTDARRAWSTEPTVAKHGLLFLHKNVPNVSVLSCGNGAPTTRGSCQDCNLKWKERIQIHLQFFCGQRLRVIMVSARFISAHRRFSVPLVFTVSVRRRHKWSNKSPIVSFLSWWLWWPKMCLVPNLSRIKSSRDEQSWQKQFQTQSSSEFNETQEQANCRVIWRSYLSTNHWPPFILEKHLHPPSHDFTQVWTPQTQTFLTSRTKE